jgi:hypothetical protein
MIGDLGANRRPTPEGGKNKFHMSNAERIAFRVKKRRAFALLG